MTTIQGIPDHLQSCGSFVASLGGPERMGKCVFDWLSTEQPLLRSVGLDSQHKADRSAVQHFCPRLLLGKCFLGASPFP